MEVRSFEALNVKDAVKAVKSKLGNDAIILSIKHKERTDGTAGKTVEIKATSPKLRGGGVSGDPGSDDLASIYDALSNRLGIIESRVSAINDNMVRRDLFETMATSLRDIKALVRTSNPTQMTPQEDQYDFIRSICEQLRISNVGPKSVGSLAEHLASLAKSIQKTPLLDDQVDLAKAEAIKWMMRKIQIAPKWTPTGSGPAVHLLMGPPGVGKTSTIAKIASHAKVKSNLNVVLVSFDKGRIAASEQLRIFSKVIDAKYESIDSPEEIVKVLSKNTDAQLVLVDTTGVSIRSRNSLRELRKFSNLTVPVDTHLVLSATDRGEQHEQSVRNFSEVGISSVVFTKFDECVSYGDAFNICDQWSLPLSYFSTGPNVPEDIERASRERVVERIFGL